MRRPKAKTKKKDWKQFLDDEGSAKKSDDSGSSSTTNLDEGPSQAFLELKKEMEEKEKAKSDVGSGDAKKRKLADDDRGKQPRRKEEVHSRKRSRVFFDIEVKSNGRSAERLGTMVFELFDETVPLTAKNFYALCTGEKGRTLGPLLDFGGTRIHRVVPGFVVQGGDITAEDGTGGFSIYGESFKDENFVLRHEKRGMLSMANAGKDTNSSQFFISFGRLPHLDGKHVVFGQLIKGQRVLDDIEQLGSKSGDTKKDIFISDCGRD